MRTAQNVFANVGGRLWQTLMSFLFIPLYIRFMGVEAYGLIGVFTTLLAILILLDLGLSLAVNREMARLSAHGDHSRARDLVRTLEVMYWLIGLAVATGIFFGAELITRHWLNLSRLPLGTATKAVQLMAVVTFLRWPGALYGGVLMGLREHVTLNAVAAVTATLTGAGAVAILWAISPSVIAFFTWQIAVAALNIVALSLATWRKLGPAVERARFDRAALRSILGFSAGVFGVTLLSVMLMQLDKLVISSTLPLAIFGYYTLAFAIGNVLSSLAAAVHGALFPSLSHLVAAGDEEAVAALYHKSCQVMALAVVPAGTALAFFAPELLNLYLRDAQTTAQVQSLVIVFAVANTLYGMLMMPYALQLAYGWTRLSIYKNVAALLLYIPMLLIAVHRFGVIGAPLSWLALMIGYLVCEVGIMHRRLLRGHMARWYLFDVLGPWALAAAIIGAGRLIANDGMPISVRVAICLTATAAAGAAIIVTSPTLRAVALRFARGRGRAPAPTLQVVVDARQAPPPAA